MIGHGPRAAIASLGLAAVLALLLLALASPATAEDWKTYRFGAVTVDAPANWTITYQQRNNEVQLADPDGVYKLLAFWWFPDEPLLGYADIVSHRDITIAGQAGMLIVSDFPESGIYSCHILEPRKDGKQFVINLEFEDKDFDKAMALLDRILARVRYGGKKGAASPPPAPKAKPPAKTAAAPAGDGLYTDEAGGFSIRQPEGWKTSTSVRGGMRLVALAPPDGKGLVLAASFAGNADETPDRMIDAYESIYYSDYVIPSSIEADGSGRIGSLKGRFVDVIGDIYAVEGTRLGFAAGRSRFFRAVAGGRGYVVAVIQDEALGDSFVGALNAVAGSFRPAGPAPAPDVAEVAEDEPPPANVLFDGKLDERWQPLSTAGGDFKAFARTEDGMLAVDVPAGHSWGKTGIRSAAPLVEVPRADGKTVARLTFEIDPGKTTDFVYALIPGSGVQDEWFNHHVRVGLSTAGDGTSASLHLWIRQAEVMTVAADPQAVERLAIVLRPDGTVLVLDRNDTVLLQGVLPEAAPPDGYAIYALAHAPQQNKPTRMALRRISLEAVPYERPADPTALLDGAQQVVLFDGHTLGRRWARHGGQGGDFARHARLEDGALVVDVPEGAQWGKVGLYSPQPLIWLDRFGEGAEERVTFTFDPERTTGFVLAITPIHGLGGNDPSKPYALLHWRRLKDGTGAKASLLLEPDKPNAPLWELALPARAPDTVAFVFTPQGLRIEAEGLPGDTMAWAPIAPSQSFRIYAYSQPDAMNLPVKMALRKIVLDRKAGAPIAPPAPAEGVADLPVRTLFDGKPNDWWESAGGQYHPDYAKYVSFAGGSMIAEVPGDQLWGQAGLLSKKPVVDLDERIARTSYKLSLTVDPKQTTGFQVVFSTRREPHMWNHRTISLTFIHYTEGPNAGRYVLALGSLYKSWWRAVDADWVEKNWDGRLDIETGDGWMAVSIPGGPAVRGSDLNIKMYYRLYATIYANPEKDHGIASKLVLRKVTGQWVPAAGMTAGQRWTYLGKDAFDPAGFLRDLAVDFPAPAADGKGEQGK